MSLHDCGEKPHCFQAAHSAPLPFVSEPQSQPACKIDELVHGVVTMGDSRRWGREGRSVCVRWCSLTQQVTPYIYQRRMWSFVAEITITASQDLFCFLLKRNGTFEYRSRWKLFILCASIIHQQCNCAARSWYWLWPPAAAAGQSLVSSSCVRGVKSFHISLFNPIWGEPILLSEWEHGSLLVFGCCSLCVCVSCVCVRLHSHTPNSFLLPYLKNNLTPRSAQLSEYLRNPSIAGFKRYFYPTLCVTRWQKRNYMNNCFALIIFYANCCTCVQM